ncbi:MAG: restriction endonuclease [Candidatus Moranbacteria bacterium]|nr:restriction endonuclease [Candidatus Moranbacteria bacterium]
MSKSLTTAEDVKEWLKSIYADFNFDIIGFATKQGKVIPLNLEPGTLGNVIEGVLIAHLHEKLNGRKDAAAVEGGNRYYPDIELSGSLFDNKVIAFDIKAARRNERNPNRTQSRITLYTFGTYLKCQDKKFPQTIRPFQDYAHHLDLIVVFDVNNTEKSVTNFEILIVEPWKVASKTLSSATRDYVGAVMEIDKIREEKGGVFRTQKEFYKFWAGIPRRGERRA